MKAKKPSMYGRSRYLCIHIKNKDQDDILALDLEDVLYISTICNDNAETVVSVSFKTGTNLEMAVESKLGPIVYEAYKAYNQAKII